MSTKKIIPCLDMKGGRVVKGVNFVNLTDAGDPAEIARAYCAAGADELVLLDIAATNEERKTMLDVVKKVAAQVTVPFCVGGGIGSVDDIEAILYAGADKISINSAAVKNPRLIADASAKFGSGRLVVAIDVAKREDSGYDVVINGGEVNAGLDVIEWAKEVEALGAGEILLTSKDFDGTKAGYDLEITAAVAAAVSIPVTASGGAGTMEDFYKALTEGGAQAALAASLFHFKEVEIPELKKYLKNKGVNVNV